MVRNPLRMSFPPCRSGVRRPDGATLKELMKATSWQPHSVRGFLSGTIGKNMGLKVTSTKGEGEGRHLIGQELRRANLVQFSRRGFPSRRLSFSARW